MLGQFIQSKTLLSIAPRQWMVGFASIGLVGVWAKYRVLQKKKKKIKTNASGVSHMQHKEF
jgi:hypothetical protein